MRRSYASGQAGPIPAMRKNIADAFGLPLDAVSVKATTRNISALPAKGWGLRPTLSL